MTTRALATILDPVDPAARSDAKNLADRLNGDTPVEATVRAMLDDVAHGARVVVLRPEDEVTPAQDRLCEGGPPAPRRLPSRRHRRIRVQDVVDVAAEREQRQAGATQRTRRVAGSLACSGSSSTPAGSADTALPMRSCCGMRKGITTPQLHVGQCATPVTDSTSVDHGPPAREVLIEQQPRAPRASGKSVSASRTATAYSSAALMSAASRSGCSARICSFDIPCATIRTTVFTGNRMPRMVG